MPSRAPRAASHALVVRAAGARGCIHARCFQAECASLHRQAGMDVAKPPGGWSPTRILRARRIACHSAGSPGRRHDSPVRDSTHARLVCMHNGAVRDAPRGRVAGMRAWRACVRAVCCLPRPRARPRAADVRRARSTDQRLRRSIACRAMRMHARACACACWTRRRAKRANRAGAGAGAGVWPSRWAGRGRRRRRPARGISSASAKALAQHAA